MARTCAGVRCALRDWGASFGEGRHMAKNAATDKLVLLLLP
jgi:hypothetical protein